jgi:hypothetical protein
MCPLISADQFIRERQTWHETSLLQPENCGKRARKEDSFDAGEGNQAYSEWLLVSSRLANIVI